MSRLEIKCSFDPHFEHWLTACWSISPTKKLNKNKVAKKLLGVRSLPCVNLHSDLCMMRMQDVCLVTAAAVGCLYFHLLQYQTMVMGGMHNVPLQSILKPLNSWSFFFLFRFFCSWMSDRQLCSFKWEREREFLPLIVFLGCLESVSWCFEKIGYAIKLNIVMLEWSSTQLWSPDAIWK